MRVLHLPVAYLFTVSPRSYRFVDFGCFFPRFRDFHHPAFFATDKLHGMPFTYPAPGALVYEFFYSLHSPKISFVILTGIVVVFAGAKFAVALKRRGLSRGAAFGFVTICLLCSWPLFVTYWLGNIEIVIGILLGSGLYLFVTGRSWWAATLISVAIAVKIYPFVFLALFLGKRQYKQMAWMIGLAGAINVGALWLISGSIAVSAAGIASGLKYFQNIYALPYNRIGTGIDHSLFSFFKSMIFAFVDPYPSLRTMAALLRGYTVLMAALDLSLYFLRIRFLPLLNQVLCLCALAILTTPVSVDYTFMQLYVAWGMLVLLAIEAWRDERQIPGLKAAFLCFVLLFSCLSELMFHGLIFGGQIKTAVLVALLVIALRYKFVAQQQPSLYAPA